MVANPNIQFHLTRGNPFGSNSLGLSQNKKLFGQSLGGKIFLEEKFLDGSTYAHKIKSETTEIFDPFVLSDIVKNKISYRCVYIRNIGTDFLLLDSIESSVLKSLLLDDPICAVSIATDGKIYTINQLNRNIPAEQGQPGNPSIFIDDEYDSTNKLSGLSFKSSLTSEDLPVEIPPNCAMALWIKRELDMPRNLVPDGEFFENIQITIKEYQSTYETILISPYSKADGRIPLSNWYDFTITSGYKGPVVMKELLPKEVELSSINPIKTFVKKNLVIVFYYTILDNVKNYHILVIDPHDNINENKYVHILLEPTDILENAETVVEKKLVDVFKSHYDEDTYYMIWNNKIQSNSPNQFGVDSVIDRITVEIPELHIWLDDTIFKSIPTGYEYRKIVTYSPIKNKKIRDMTSVVNVEQFDDLFIMFTTDTRNSEILNISGINLNRNQLLYVFEKDIISNPSSTSVLSHRLYPESFTTTKYPNTYNNSKNSTVSLIFSKPSLIKENTTAGRRIKTLVDGNRYIDLNSATLSEFDIKNSFVTNEYPIEKQNLTSLFSSFSVAINSDDFIVDNKKDFYLQTYVLSNIVNDQTFTKPAFQTNIIDDKNSISIPVEWVDREYKDEWKTIVGSLPVNGKSAISIQYNFKYNLWKAQWEDSNGQVFENIINKLSNQSTPSSSGTSGTSGTPTSGTSGTSGTSEFGKTYENINILDLPYIIEPDTYQPFSVKVSYVQINTGLFSVNYKLWFKGSEQPLITINTTLTDVSSLGYICINAKEHMNMRINYFDFKSGTDVAPESYIVKTLHNALYHKLKLNYGVEARVNPELFTNQSDFKYYRRIQMENPPTGQSEEVTVPIVLYGQAFARTTIGEQSITPNSAFDFKKLYINDKTIRFYFDNDLLNPIPFKIHSYDYENEYAVIWVKISNWSGTNKNLYMFYGKVNLDDSILELRNQYVFLKNEAFGELSLGAWVFDRLYFDQRLSFASGKIFNMGEPVIYEKNGKEIHLTRIDKEYMYGIAKVFKSNKFNIELNIPAEESLFFEEKKKEEFISFIKDTVRVLKPSYTEINNITQYGYDIIESGVTCMGETTNKRVSGLTVLTPNSNVQTYYDRKADNKFNLLTSFNGYEKKIDWVVSKPLNTPVFKSGVLKINGKVKSETIRFDTPFKDANYFIFLSSPVNQHLYWQTLCNDRFTVTASHYLLKEVSWMAFHKDVFGGVYTPNSIFVGKRTLTNFVETPGGEDPSSANLSYWYNNTLIIKPDIGIEGDAGTMNIPVQTTIVPPGYNTCPSSTETPGSSGTISETDAPYSVLLSANENINTYWTKKASNQFTIKTSSPSPSVVHWLVIKNGVEWWKELE